MRMRLLFKSHPGSKQYMLAGASNDSLKICSMGIISLDDAATEIVAKHKNL